jgi:hypothetical protein
MAAGTWNFFKTGKQKVGQALMNFDGGNLRISLHSVGASAQLLADNSATALGSIANELSAANGYVAGGKSIDFSLSYSWRLSGTTALFSGPEVFWSANGGNLGGSGSIKYAVIHVSQASGTKSNLCYVTLSASPFQVGDGSRLTINSGGAVYWTLN